MKKDFKEFYRDPKYVEKYEPIFIETPGGKYIHDVESSAIASLLPSGDSIVIELPSGTGRFSRSLSKEVNNLIVMDSSFPMLKKTLQRVSAPAANALATSLPLADGSVGGFVTIRLFHLLSRDEIFLFLGEVRRTLNKGGFFIFDINHDIGMCKALKYYQRTKATFTNWPNMTFVNPKEMKKILNSMGFQVHRIEKRFVIQTGVLRLAKFLHKMIFQLDRFLQNKCSDFCTKSYWLVTLK